MIELRQVVKHFNNVTALADISLLIEGRESIVIQGPSGSGKTTLLRTIAGLELPDEGEIHLDGFPASRPGWGIPPYLRGIGFVFQRSALWPHMTVAQNILFAMNGALPQEKRDRLDELLVKADLLQLAGRYPGQLSGGEARRTAVARALAARPERLLLDEPLTNLDPQLKYRLPQVVLDYVREQKATLLYVTHDLEEIRSIQGRVVILERGRIL
jgi:iron(III) transport system ATP-binding protein